MYYIYAFYMCLGLKEVTRRCQILQVLKLQMVVRHCVGAENQAQVLWKSTKCSKSPGHVSSFGTIVLESVKGDQSPGVGGSHTST